MRTRHARPNVSPADLEAVRKLYAGDDLTNVEIAARYGRPPNWVNWLAAKHGWPLRGARWRPGMKRDGRIATPPPEPKVRTGRASMTPAQIAAARQAENDLRIRTAYGAVLDDANYLRRKDFVVTAAHAGVFVVDGKRLTNIELHALAERERRLERPAVAPVVAAPKRQARGRA